MYWEWRVLRVLNGGGLGGDGGCVIMGTGGIELLDVKIWWRNLVFGGGSPRRQRREARCGAWQKKTSVHAKHTEKSRKMTSDFEVMYL